MNRLHIHYRESDGEIFGFENTQSPTQQPSLAVTTVEIVEGCHAVPDGKLYKIDLTTLGIVDKSPEEIALANLPTLDEVKMKIAGALRASDAMMMPDRPIAQSLRDQWITYRQALRDLSELPAPSMMLDAWPTIPPEK